jgi:hypothetical protein
MINSINDVFPFNNIIYIILKLENIFCYKQKKTTTENK